MLKVLIVSVGKMSGGVESYTLILGKMLADNGFDVHYAVRAGAWLDGQLTTVKKLTVGLGRSLVADMKNLKKYVMDNDINIVHCNSNNGLFISQLIKESKKCVKIGVVHGDVKIDQNHKGLFIRFMYEKLETWLLKKKCTQCIAVSKSIKDILISRGISSDKIDVVYNCVEPFHYKNAPDYFADELKIVSVGNLLPVKNHICLLNALLMVSSKYPEVKYICDIFGEGPERESLENYIADNNIKNVHLKGFDNNVRNKLNTYQLCINTSNYESFGISIIEAMSAGCCVIASNVGGLKEIINRDCGFIVEKNDSDAIADKIFYCFRDRQSLMEKARKGKARCDKEFSEEAMSIRLLEVYRKLM